MNNNTNESEKIKLSNSAKVLMAYIGARKFKWYFLNIFFVAYFYKISEQNIFYLSLYNLVVFIVGTIAALLLGNAIKSKYKMPIFRLGTVLYCLYLFLIIYLKEDIINHIYLIGFISGLGNCMCGFTFNMIQSEQIDIKERSKFEGYQSALSQTISLIIPIFLGAYITINSYEITATLVLVFTILTLIITLFIKDKNVQTKKMDLKRFAKILKDPKSDLLKKVYHIEFLRGITVSGTLTLIVMLLIVSQFESNLDLGIMTSIFAFLTITTMLWFGRFFNKNKPKNVLKLCVIAIIIGMIPLMFSINIYTVIIYHIIFSIFVELLNSITQVRLFDYSNKIEFKTALNTEYFMFREFYINSGRIVGYSILLFIGLTNNLVYLKVFLFLITLLLIYIAWLSNKISKSER